MTPKEITDLRIEGLMKFNRRELEQMYMEIINAEYPMKSGNKEQVARAVFEAAKFKKQSASYKNIVV